MELWDMRISKRLVQMLHSDTNVDVEREAEAGIYAPKLEFYADDKRAMLRFLWMTNRPC